MIYMYKGFVVNDALHIIFEMKFMHPFAHQNIYFIKALYLFAKYIIYLVKPKHVTLQQFFCSYFRFYLQMFCNLTLI
jgi:hypothetical protein